MTSIILNMLSAASLFVSLIGQEITLYNYEQKDSLTNCTHGLVDGVDTVVFKSRVDYTKDTEAKHVYFQIRKENEHQFVVEKFVDIKKDCDGISNNNCLHIDTYVIAINITLMATTDYNRALIRGKLITSNEKEISSEEQVFPEISDVTNIIGSVEINGKSFDVNGTECDLTNDDNYVLVVYKCESDVLPCVIEISDGNPTETKQDLNSLVFYQKDIDEKKTIRIKIKHDLCSMHTNSTVMECTIHTGPKSKIWIAVLIFMIIAVATIGQGGCMLRLHYKQANEKKNMTKELVKSQSLFRSMVKDSGKRRTSNENSDEVPLLTNDANFEEGS